MLIYLSKLTYPIAGFHSLLFCAAIYNYSYSESINTGADCSARSVVTDAIHAKQCKKCPSWLPQNQWDGQNIFYSYKKCAQSQADQQKVTLTYVQKLSTTSRMWDLVPGCSAVSSRKTSMYSLSTTDHNSTAACLLHFRISPSWCV